jgi:hypothetical protein
MQATRTLLAGVFGRAAPTYERCREGDGALHWRPEVVYALGEAPR